MSEYIVACRFGHAFVCRTWLSKAKARPGRRYQIASNWRSLEAQAIKEVQEQAGGWPACGFFSCSPDLAGQTKRRMTRWPRTQVKRAMTELAAMPPRHTWEIGDVMILVVSKRGLSCQVIRLIDRSPWYERALNWRDLRAAAKQAVLDANQGSQYLRDTLCPPDLAARAIWPGG